MWPWRRATRDPGPDSPATSPEPGPVYRERSSAWRDLPPVQRVVADHPLVNPPERMPVLLSSWHSPSFLAPLGHAVSASEPSGVIAGMATAVPASSPSPPPPSSSVA